MIHDARDCYLPSPGRLLYVVSSAVLLPPLSFSERPRGASGQLVALDIAPDPSKLLELHGLLELPPVRAPEIGQSVAQEQHPWVSSGNSGHRKGQGDPRLRGTACGRQRVERWAVVGRAGCPEQDPAGLECWETVGRKLTNAVTKNWLPGGSSVTTVRQQRVAVLQGPFSP